MITQWLTRKNKLLQGFLRTRIGGRTNSVDPNLWFDENVFVDGVGDSITISPDFPEMSAAYHYASVEMLILRHFCNKHIEVRSKRVCDIGSGAGHWLDFYLELGASQCVGIDIAERAVAFLSRKYADDDRVSLLHGAAHQVLADCDKGFDLVNAIGVLFHVVDDQQWRQTIDEIRRVLNPGGHLVVGGHFGLINNLNTQFDRKKLAFKRVRSGRHWKSVLRSAGFDSVDIYRNHAYLHVPGTLPENNVLIARAHPSR